MGERSTLIGCEVQTDEKMTIMRKKNDSDPEEQKFKICQKKKLKKLLKKKKKNKLKNLLNKFLTK